MGKTFDEGKHMSQIYKEIKRNGIPHGAEISEKSKKIINFCLQLNPSNRPTAM